MRTFKSLSILFPIIFLFIGCINIPKNSKFKYYSKDYVCDNSNLRFNLLYMADTQTLEYLTFQKDGFVSYFGSTAMSPDTVIFFKINLPERKRNGQPVDKSDDFGYFLTKGDSLFMTIHRVGLFGSESLFELIGRVYVDSLVFNVTKLPVYEHETAYDLGKSVFVPYP